MSPFSARREEERLQGDVVREDGLRRLSGTSIGAAGVRGRGVQLGEKKTRLRSPGIADDESR